MGSECPRSCRSSAWHALADFVRRADCRSLYNARSTESVFPVPCVLWRKCMRAGVRLSLLVLSCLLLLATAPDNAPPLSGYSTASSRSERDWESKFRAIPEPQNQRDYMQRLAARPHHV